MACAGIILAGFHASDCRHVCAAIIPDSATALRPRAEKQRPAAKETFHQPRDADAIQRLEASRQVPLGVFGSLLASQGKSDTCRTPEKCSTRGCSRSQ